jgi:hypothetical protein
LPPKRHRAECHRTRVLCARSLFGTASLPTQSVFSWLDLALRPGEPRSSCSCRKNASRLGHHFRRRWVTRLVRVMGRHRRLFRGSHRRCRRWCTRTRCLSPTSAADFCCHEHPLGSQLPSLRLTPPGPPCLARSPCRRRNASSRTEPTSTMSDSHFWRLRPWVAAWLTPRLPAAANTTALWETPVASGVGPRQLCRLSASPVRWLHTPPVAIRTTAGKPTDERTTRARFPCRTSLGSFRELEASFTARSRGPILAFARTWPREPPPVPRLCHREPGFQHAFTPPLGALDPSI